MTNPAALGFTKWPEKVAGSFSGRVVVCGSGHCLWKDLEKLLGVNDRRWSFEVCAVKQSGMHLPMKIQHWASCHGERFQWMLPLRKESNGESHYHFQSRLPNGLRGVHPYTQGIAIHAEKLWPMVSHAWECKLTGTSALFATKVMLALGYDEVILAGVPLDNRGYYYGPQVGGGLGNNDQNIREWEEFLPAFDGRVKSMSGRTRELLGGV